MATNTPPLHSVTNLYMGVLLDMKKKDLETTLNWLLAMGIINAVDYNNIYMKSLPYVK